MRWMDTTTYLATQNNPAADPIISFVDDGVEPMMPATDEHGRVTKSGAIGFVAAYAVLASLLLYLFRFV